MYNLENDEENSIMKEDKILNNSFNAGEIDTQAFISPMRVEDGALSLYEDQLSDNLVEQRVAKLLDEDLYNLFQESPYHLKYKASKRVDKGDIIKMFYYFKEKLLKANTYSGMQIFIGFAEFFQVNYDQLYSEIGVLDKESLLKELSEKGKVKHKIKTRKLF
jgi:hypothetical protein